MTWRTVGPLEWLLVDRPQLSEPVAHGTAGPDVEVALLFARGYAHEAPAELGVTAAALAALSQELRRPRELAGPSGPRVVAVDVGNRVHLQDSALVLRGEADGVRAALEALEQLVLAPDALRAAGRPQQRSSPWNGYHAELIAWFGLGPAALGVADEESWTGPEDVIHRVLRDLHPARGGRLVAWTDAPELVGSVFAAGPPPAPPAAGPLRWREPSPSVWAGAVSSGYANNLSSVRVPTTTTAELALWTLHRMINQALVDMTGLVADLQAYSESVGGQTLWMARAVPHEAETDWLAVRGALQQSLEAYAEQSDHALAEAVEQARANGLLARDALTCAARALQTPVRTTPNELMAELGLIEVDQLRDATREVLAGSLISVYGAEPPPPGRPVFQPAPLPVVDQPSVRRRGYAPVTRSTWSEQHQVRATSQLLEVAATPVGSPSDPAAQPSQRRVDLTSIAVRYDVGAEFTTLVDRENRTATIVWPIYVRPDALRQLIDAATPAASVVRRPANAVTVAQLRSSIFRARSNWVGWAVAVAFTVGLVIYLLTR